MLLQRARVAESRVKHRSSKWTAEGAVKCAKFAQSILQREGIRQLPGICWYPAESAVCNRLANQGGIADKLLKNCFIRP